MSLDELGSEEGHQNMEIDTSRDGKVPEGDNETDYGQESTPQPSDEEDGTTAEEEEPNPLQIKEDEGPNPSSNTQRSNVPGDPPPRRELPFTRKPKGGKETQMSRHRAQDDIEDTAGETEDDEL